MILVYDCIRCGDILTRQILTSRITNKHAFNSQLYLKCDNCGFKWRGAEDASPIKPRQIKDE